MKLKFLLDENLSPLTVDLLRDLGLEAVHIYDVGLIGKSDEEIYEFAKKKKYVIITFDKVFAYYFFKRKDIDAFILLRIFPQTFEILNESLKNFFNKVKEEEIVGNMIVIQANKYRIKKVK